MSYGVKVIWVGYGYGMVVYIWVDKGRVVVWGMVGNVGSMGGTE